MSYYQIIFAFIALCVVIIVIAGIKGARKKQQLLRSEMIEIGMSEREMLEIMGSGYTLSKLKDNRTKYEWRIKASSYGRNGYRTYSGVQRATIYCRNGVVEEVRGMNLR